MTREELHQFAAAGVAQKIAAIEKELSTYHKEWPELFLSATAPQLLKAALKNGNNTHWPIGENGTAPSRKTAEWTPERRAKQAAIMRKRSKAMHQAKARQHAAHIAKIKAGDLTPMKSRPMSEATRRKMSLAMKRRHASGEIAKAIAAARKAKASA